MKSKRKFYLMLPVLVLPFVTLAFWALGGGKTNEEVKQSTGLNLNLPDAKLKDDKNPDKLSFYNQADKDSIKRGEAIRNDPSYKFLPDTALSMMPIVRQNSIHNISPSNNIDESEQKIYSKINELNKQISQPYVPASQISSGEQKDSNGKDLSVQVDKLQSMMKVMTEKNGGDSETIQLNGMLDKILDIQHPERVRERVKEKSVTKKNQVFAVESSFSDNSISTMQPPQVKDHNFFYDMADAITNDSTDHGIEAVVHERQTLFSGSTVKMRMINDIYVNGILIPKNNFIYGTATLENERLNIIISSIRFQNNLLPVALQVYDMDGLSGIYIPGSISMDAIKQSGQQSMQGVEFNSLDPSVAAQVTTAGISAAKNLLSKKSKLIKITQKAGYKVLLKDNNKNN